MTGTWDEGVLGGSRRWEEGSDQHAGRDVESNCVVRAKRCSGAAHVGNASFRFELMFCLQLLISFFVRNFHERISAASIYALRWNWSAMALWSAMAKEGVSVDHT